jgi:hypothetical protein
MSDNHMREFRRTILLDICGTVLTVATLFLFLYALSIFVGK